MSPYLYALAGCFWFGLAAQIFTKYSRRVSAVWINAFKGTLAFVCFFITVMVAGGFHAVALKSVFIFMLSGCIGLGIGDIFLIQAFAQMGPGRTMVLYAFQPFMIGVISYFLFGQTIDGVRMASIFLFVCCVFIFSLESYRKSGRWGVNSISLALLGIACDSAGIILTRIAFNGSGLRPVEGNFYRSIGAVISFLIILPLFKIDFFKTLKSFSKKATAEIFVGSFLGAYLSLMFYLAALKNGNLASITAMSITGVLFAAGFECIFEKKWPSKYLITAFACFTAGTVLLLR